MYANPTMNELMQGIISWHMRNTMVQMWSRSKNEIIKETNQIIKVYEDIFDSININDLKIPVLESQDPILGVLNPYSKICCFVMILYSMELGTPPLYAEVNRVVREMDMKLLQDFGPFLKVLSDVS